MATTPMGLFRSPILVVMTPLLSRVESLLLNLGLKLFFDLFLKLRLFSPEDPPWNVINSDVVFK